MKDDNKTKNPEPKTSKINPEIKYIIENKKYNDYDNAPNKYNFYQPFYSLGPIYSINPFNNDLVLNVKKNYSFYDSNKNNINDNIKKEKKNYYDINPETNSLSHLSTTSDGENNYYFYQSHSEEKKIGKKIKNKHLYESIKKGIKDITDNFNSNNLDNAISFACYYYCDINMDEQEELLLGTKIKNLVDDYKKNVDKK